MKDEKKRERKSNKHDKNDGNYIIKTRRDSDKEYLFWCLIY